MEYDVRLISSSYRSLDGEPIVELYGKTREGKSIVVLVFGFHPYFFVVSPSKGLREQLIGDPEVVSVEEDQLFLKGSVQNVLKVTYSKPWNQTSFTNRLKTKYQLLATDISYQDRFVYDNDLSSCIRVKGKEIPAEYYADLVIKYESSENIESFDPGLKILSFDIENSVKHDYLLTICSTVHDNNGIRLCKAATGNEKEIIQQFSEIIRKEDPDVITGYNIDNYDIKKIVERAKVNKIADALNWGRDGSGPLKINDRFWRIKGRLVVDAWFAARKEIRPKQETLNAVAMQVLGESKMDVDPMHMDEEWIANKEKVIEYCFKDSELALRILMSVGTVRKGMDLATVSKLPVEDVLVSGTSTLVDSLLIRAADREKVGVPGNGKRIKGEQIEGGYVHEFNPGLYRRVAVLDFKSMYPSLIISKNICFTTLSSNGEIESPIGVRYLSKEKKEGILPRILSKLMDERDSIKKRMKSASGEEHDYLDGLQAAVKVMMNTFYGVFASSFYRFTDKQIGSSITSFARSTVLKIINEAESKGKRVIYSDTDSIFMESPYDDIESTITFGKEMAQRYSTDGGTLEFEKVLDPLFTHGKKKRYVGRVVWPERSEDLLVRGYEIRRSDSFDLQSSLLTKLFEYVLDENNDDALALVKKTIQDVLKEKVPVDSLVISKGCKGLDAYENPERQANVQAAKKLIAMGYEFIPGMKVSWIVTNSSKTPQTVEPYVSGKEFTGKPDYKYYAERIAQTASRITEVFGWTEKDLMQGSQQSTLFGGMFDYPSESKKSDLPQKTKGKNTKLTDFF